eukprot:TRINITY_DN20002_c0_g1_i1.p1 TRINITY_DN20002_c0_g1~~TRINITY_DN20002_c0_g1_i1.p1  ORF type:complete len:593 (-),score=146.64 TRINITY_DN20002_c0_g1_i1:30-1658(-)
MKGKENKGAPIIIGNQSADFDDLDRLKKTQKSQTVFDTLRAIDVNLVTTRSGSPRNAFFVHNLHKGRHVVPGSVGCGSKKGKALFYPEGYYPLCGLGNKFGLCIDLNSSLIRNKDVVIINLKENEAAIITSTTQTFAAMGPNQYVARAPYKIIGQIVDLGNISAAAGTRGHLEFKDPETQSIRATIFHVGLGEVAITQTPSGLREYGPGNYIMTGSGEKFVRKLSIIETEQSMDASVRTSDGLSVVLSIYTTMRIDDPTLFHMTKYENAGDALDEQIQARFNEFFQDLSSRDIVTQSKALADDGSDSADSDGSETKTSKKKKKNKGKGKVEKKQRSAKTILREAAAWVFEELQTYAEEKGVELLAMKIMKYEVDAAFRTMLEAQAGKAMDVRNKREMLRAKITTEKMQADADAELAKRKAEHSADVDQFEARQLAQRDMIKAQSIADVANVANEAEIEREVRKISAIAEARAKATLQEAEAQARALEILGKVRAALPAGHAQNVEMMQLEVQKYKEMGKGTVYLPVPQEGMQNMKFVNKSRK